MGKLGPADIWAPDRCLSITPFMYPEVLAGHIRDRCSGGGVPASTRRLSMGETGPWDVRGQVPGSHSCRGLDLSLLGTFMCLLSQPAATGHMLREGVQ